VVPAAGGGDAPAAVTDAEAIYSADFEVTYDVPKPLHVEVLSLTRQPADTVRLELTFTHSNTDSEAGDLFLSAVMGPIANLSLIDLTENKRYLVITDDQGTGLCNEIDDFLAAGVEYRAYATFPAPPAGTSVVDIQLPSVGLLPGIPITG
jgi:hypothetical protein